MKPIYEEALEKAWDLVHNKYPENNEEIQLVRYAIKTAMELTKRIGELEQEHIEYSKKVQVQFSNDTKRIGELESKLIIQEKLLELYRYLNENTNDYDLHPDKVDEIHNKIEELEK